MDSLKYIFALLVSCFIAGNSNAQELTNEQQEEIRMRIIQTVDEFQDGLLSISNNQLSHAARKEYVNRTLKLFIGNGEPYSYYDEEEGKQVNNSGVKIQVSDKQRGMKKSQRLKNYIYKFYNAETGKVSLRYNGINIEAVDALICDNIIKVGDHYECITFYHSRILERLNDGRIEFSICPSKTTKIRCYIQSVEGTIGETTFSVKLGDIYTIQEKRY